MGHEYLPIIEFSTWYRGRDEFSTIYMEDLWRHGYLLILASHVRAFMYYFKCT